MVLGGAASCCGCALGAGSGDGPVVHLEPFTLAVSSLIGTLDHQAKVLERHLQLLPLMLLMGDRGDRQAELAPEGCLCCTKAVEVPAEH